MRVWNITHLTQPEPKFIRISSKRCAPGKSVEVESLTNKELDLVGSYLYIGNMIPDNPSNSESPLTKEEAAEVLSFKTKKELLDLCKFISPSLGNDLESKSIFWLRSKVCNAIYSDSFEVSPQKFLWTNMWEQTGYGYRRV